MLFSHIKNESTLLFGTLILFIIVLYSPNLSAQSDEFSSNNLIKFTQFLYNNSEYERVLDELNRYKYYFNSSEKIIVTEKLTWLNLGKGNQKFWYNQKKEALGEIFYIMGCNNNNYSNENVEFHQFVDKELESIYYEQLIFNQVMNNQFDQLNHLFKFTDEKNNKKVIDFIDQYKYDQKKSSLALLTGIIPGGGYFYGGKRETGLLAAVVISVFSSVAYISYRNENKYIAISSGTIASLFYGGSILGGYMQTNKYNKNLKKQLLYRISYTYNYEKDKQYIYNNYGIGRD